MRDPSNLYLDIERITNEAIPGSIVRNYIKDDSFLLVIEVLKQRFEKRLKRAEMLEKSDAEILTIVREMIQGKA